MTEWDKVRALARLRHTEALTAGHNVSAHGLLAAAERLTGVESVALPADHPLLSGSLALYDREMATIWFSQDVPRRLAAFYRAHEFGHLWLDGTSAICTADDLDAEASEEASPFGAQRVEGYGPQERRERRANIFGCEFLLPSDVLRRWVVGQGMTATAIADRVGVPEGMVLHQLASALLAPVLPAPSAAGESGAAVPALDSSQAEAAQVEHGPLLLEAGPGTGKTRTLMGRIAALLDRGVPPSTILALTFSNRAAEEMRSRLTVRAPDAAAGVWIGTFHAFGLELMRKYGERIGLPPRPEVIDPADALFLLERLLPELALDHYQNLYEPTLYLRDILSAISRAKDELVDPARYALLAEQMRARATTEDEAVTAGKALEVARVYAIYQRSLDESSRLDFGDLIVRAVQLLRSRPDVRDQLRSAYPHVLVDEYQDVNRASGLLLQELAGDGRGLWVVGDPRQSIYRFRGAAPANMHLFATDFSGARMLALRRNYRSQPPVVALVSAFANQMTETADSFTAWGTERSDAGGKVLFEIALDERAEAAGIAAEIERQREAGVVYRDQAVLCRSHTTLARIAAGLEAAGVPILYLGDLFERPEIRDLLSLMALSCDADGRGLVRVARFAEYGIPLADVRLLLACAHTDNQSFPTALQGASEVEGLSAAGSAAITLLGAHLDDRTDSASPWHFLAHYLFNRSRYLGPLLRDDSVSGQQRRLALYQFLRFAHDQQRKPALHEITGAEARRQFLRYVQRLEIFGEEKQLRQAPNWADGIDAVRLLTVHASKGLEFPVVYVPALAMTYFPGSRHFQPCPPPAGMASAVTGDDHAAEEQCLFFVALSRARDMLCLSRAQRYGKVSHKASSFLTPIAGLLPRPPDGDVTWSDDRHDVEDMPVALPVPAIPMRTFWAEALEVYLTCPRRYYYEFTLGLEGKRDDSAYVQFHRAVYAVLFWLQGERAGGREVDDEAIQAKLALAWEETGPRGHAYEALYRQSAEELIARALIRPTHGQVRGSRLPWAVERQLGQIRLTQDHV
ncbi:MAG: UvrD-helicase domain-containing protein, partial [Dehalococcoidia bacterium]